MRRLNSLFETDYISEKGLDSRERTYFAFVPLNNYICYAVAESYDDSVGIRSEQLAVESVLSLFQREPSMKASKIKKYINYANEQLKRHGKNQDRLQASILVVVSDYTRLRYAGCGNSKLFVVNDSQLVYESKTQTRYQSVADGGVYEDALDINDSWNLTQYLGMEKKLDIQVSKKINLIENSSLVLMTCGAWNKLLTYNKNDAKQDKRGVDIIDAYEDSKTNGEFLMNLEEMALNFQHVKPIGSYSIVSCAIKKTFKEDTAKKKKRRKLLIILGIILLVLLIVLIVVIALIRSSDRALLNQIIELDNEGVRYASYGNYVKARERYTTANDLAKKVNLGNLQYTQEKKEVTKRVRERLAVMEAIDEGNKRIDAKNYAGAKTSYTYVRDEGDVYTEMNLSTMSRDMLIKINYYLEASHLTSIAEMYELSGLYAQALLNYGRALELIEQTQDFDARKELKVKILDAELKLTAKDNEIIDAAMTESERTKQIAEEIIMEKIRELTQSAVDAENSGNINGAVDIYNEILKMYIQNMQVGIGDARYDGVTKKIDELKRNQADEAAQAAANEQKDKIADLMRRAEDYVRNDQKDQAIAEYEKVIDIYIDLGLTAEVGVIRAMISELQKPPETEPPTTEPVVVE